jgi:hypothetical protein
VKPRSLTARLRRGSMESARTDTTPRERGELGGQTVWSATSLPAAVGARPKLNPPTRSDPSHSFREWCIWLTGDEDADQTPVLSSRGRLAEPKFKSGLSTLVTDRARCFGIARTSSTECAELDRAPPDPRLRLFQAEARPASPSRGGTVYAKLAAAVAASVFARRDRLGPATRTPRGRVLRARPPSPRAPGS